MPIQHRSYKTIYRDKFSFWMELILFVLISLASLYIYMSFIHNRVMTIIQTLFEQNGLKLELVGLYIYRFDIVAFDVPFLYNEPLNLFIALIALVVVMLILAYQRLIPLNMVFWLEFIFAFVVIFTIYFIFFSSNFPYTSEKYFDLYFHAYIGMVLMSFMVLSLSLALTPSGMLYKLFTLMAVIGYYFLYNFVRFCATVLLISQVSIVFVPLMYFTIFYDFILVIYIYTYILYRNTKRSQ